MPGLFIRNARVLTLGGSPAPRRGQALRELGILPKADIVVDRGVISSLTPAGAATSTRVPSDVREINARGRVVMPGFVDCHTHLCWAGSRIDEWQRLLAGETYQHIAATGGGIMSTVLATRAATQGELACDLLGRIELASLTGTTTIEVKTGYGLSTEHELKMLAAILQARGLSAVTVFPTALLAHAIDASQGAHAAAADEFVTHTIDHTLPAVHRAVLEASSISPASVAVDAFCERGAWNVEQTTRLLTSAINRGHIARAHVDQFTSMGMLKQAVWLNARSVDHLEATTPDDMRLLGSSETFGVILPACGFHLDAQYADGRSLASANVKLAIATNANPGSAPCMSMPMIIALAVRHCRLTVAEAIVAATVNPAGVLGLADRGFIALGARADLIMLRSTDERCLAYEFGSNPVEMVIAAGKPLFA